VHVHAEGKPNLLPWQEVKEYFLSSISFSLEGSLTLASLVSDGSGLFIPYDQNENEVVNPLHPRDGITCLSQKTCR